MKQHKTAGFRLYVITWAVLVILAAASVSVTQYHLGISSILVALVIASLKAGLILYIFMHLRYESWFFRLAFLLPVLVFLFMAGFTFLDVLYR
jgi:cytochrome c oxidase subunit 4